VGTSGPALQARQAQHILAQHSIAQHGLSLEGGGRMMVGFISCARLLAAKSHGNQYQDRVGYYTNIR
jgi:hypothetical protein